MLRFDLSELVRTPGMRQVFEINEPPYADEDVEFISPVTGRVTVTNTGSVVLVRGPIRTSIELECSRCLTPVRTPIDVTLEEEFDLKHVEDTTHHDQQVEIVEEEVGKVFEGKVLNLAVLIRQAALLDAPLQPLCREDCPGIPIITSEDKAGENNLSNSPFRDLSKLLEE
jgi:uncharacterized protein